MAAVMCLSFAACGNNSGKSKTVSEQQASEQTAAGSTADAAKTNSTQTQNAEQETAAKDGAETLPEGNKVAKDKVAKDGAEMQTEDKSMPTRIPPENGTKINMYFGDTLITGVLNDSETAQALIAKLPMTQHVSRYAHDFCGVTDELPYNEEDVHYGWLNGDIDYALNAPYFTILFEDEDVSEQYGYQVNIGVITTPLADISALDGSFDVRIELAE